MKEKIISLYISISLFGIFLLPCGQTFFSSAFKTKKVYLNLPLAIEGGIDTTTLTH